MEKPVDTPDAPREKIRFMYIWKNPEIFAGALPPSALPHGRVPKGIQAVTVCEITAENESKTYGYAFCSRKDRFVKRMGRTISSGRARKKMGK